MSAYVVSKHHIDLLVRTALSYREDDHGIEGFRWRRLDDNDAFVGWRELHPNAEGMPSQPGVEYCSPSAFGQILVSENVRSVHHRYPDDNPDAGELPGPIDAYYMGPYVYEWPGLPLPPGALFKALDSLEYQSCEHDGWQRSEACAILDALRLEGCCRVDGYAEAAWSL